MKTAKKSLAIILVILMLLTVLSTAATAVIAPRLYIAGVEVTAANADHITGKGITGRVSFNMQTRVLTLSNATITEYGETRDGEVDAVFFAGTSETDVLTIELIGSNRIICYSSDEYTGLYGISAFGSSLSIKNADGMAGSLSIAVGDNSFYYYDDEEYEYGGCNHSIYASGDISVTGCRLNAKSIGALGDCYTLLSYGSITFTNSIIDLFSGETEYNENGVIYAEGDLTITNSLLTAQSSYADNGWDSEAVQAYGSVTATDSGINITAGKATDDSYGIFSACDISFDNVSAHISTDDADDDSYCICANESFSAKSSELLLSSGNVLDDNYGISASYDISLTKSLVRIKLGEADNYSKGLEAEDGDLTITDCTVSAHAGNAEISKGIFVSEVAAISDSVVDAQGGAALESSIGIEASSRVVINSSEVTATAGSAEEYSCGLSAPELSSTDSRVVAESRTVFSKTDTDELNSYGINAGFLGVNGGKVIASADTCAVNCKGFNIDSAAHTVRVNSKRSPFGTTKWDFETPLYDYKYVTIGEKESFFDTIIFEITNFFTEIFSRISEIF